ncbi:MAG: caspase family protein [Candidatus Delongbacteria bacterium]|nr:caspase family protein [Candidatus Delongbacteria bacterium]MCG2761520.1 caspase family protein [Candidatus Delongbacteria bacterium]
MKKILVALMIVVAVFFISCSKNSTFEPEDTVDGSQYQRPEFIDDRPEDVKAQFTLLTSEAVELDESAAKGAKYALVIGISNYAGTVNDLNYCDDDASDWASFLQGKGYSVTKITDLAATKTAIESAMNTLASRSIAGNEIFFVYSGHGYNGNMITTDMYYLSYTWMAGKFSKSASTKMGFTFDACNIGAFKTALGKAGGRVVAVASGTKNYSYDGDSTMKNGVFTYYQILGWSSYNYFEGDNKYACEKMIAWGKAHGVRCTPSYSDTYTGNMLP